MLVLTRGSSEVKLLSSRSPVTFCLLLRQLTYRSYMIPCFEACFLPSLMENFLSWLLSSLHPLKLDSAGLSPWAPTSTYPLSNFITLLGFGGDFSQVFPKPFLPLLSFPCVWWTDLPSQAPFPVLLPQQSSNGRFSLSVTQTTKPSRYHDSAVRTYTVSDFLYCGLGPAFQRKQTEKY